MKAKQDKNPYAGALEDRQLTDDAILSILCHLCAHMDDDDIDQLYVLVRLCYKRGIIDEGIQQTYWHRMMTAEDNE